MHIVPRPTSKVEGCVSDFVYFHSEHTHIKMPVGTYCMLISATWDSLEECSDVFFLFLIIRQHLLGVYIIYIWSTEPQGLIYEQS